MDIESAVTSLLKEVGIESDVLEEVTLGDLDSLTVTEVLTLAEDAIGRAIALDTFDGGSTIADVCEFVRTCS